MICCCLSSLLEDDQRARSARPAPRSPRLSTNGYVIDTQDAVAKNIYRVSNSDSRDATSDVSEVSTSVLQLAHARFTP